MKHNYLNNTPLDEAKKIYFEHLREAGFGPRPERVKSTDGCGRVLTNAVYAKICSPHYNASAMDGPRPGYLRGLRGGAADAHQRAV